MNGLTPQFEAVLACASRLLATTLPAQHRTFIQHIANIAEKMRAKVANIPASERALWSIVPTFGDAYYQQLVALYGYAKLMLESPTTFGDDPLADTQQADLQAIYTVGVALAQQFNQLKDTAFQQRQEARKQLPAPIQLVKVLQDVAPIARYWLQDRPLQLVVQHEADALPEIFARPYHVTELIQHIVVTIGLELIEYGVIRLSLADEARCVAVHIHTQGIQFAEDDLQVLFEKNGRYIYREQLDVDEGYLTFVREKGVGATCVVHLPKAHT